MIRYNWSNTSIFQYLRKKKGPIAEEVRVFLKRPDVMDKIERLLGDGSTTPKNFTLHNDEHSFRVAEKMWALIPDITKENLSEYELAFLLLSAYLHDIGMSPKFQKLATLEQYLTSDHKSLISEVEVKDLQKWIDNEDKIPSLNVADDKLQDKKLVSYILSYYTRYKHNDWSEEWIRENIKDTFLPSLHDWVNNLIIVCKSHHFGLEHLLGQELDPKPTHNGKFLHLRYLAICLRVADVLENDPERTPDIILRHRMIDEDSLVYWLKDRQFTVRQNANRFSVYARPEKAYLQKAIEDTVDAIENELRLCEDLIKRRPLNHTTVATLNNYVWNVESFIIRDIAPKENVYTYIQGGFRPNTVKILQLLGGSQLYKDPIWAIRELIQNAFDAIKERIAYQILNENRSPGEYLSKFGEFYSVNVSLEEKSDGIWLVCDDQGVGMTKNIIERCFLASGTTQVHEIKELERRCEKSGFRLNRTGRFGIGVLSYFMIAEQIIILTKRELNTGHGDNESLAWRFEINGADDFGELTKATKMNVGTNISFKLKKDIQKNIHEWNDKVKKLLDDIIVKSACVITYKSYLDTDIINIGYGWNYSLERIKNIIVKQAHQSLMPSFIDTHNARTSEEKKALLRSEELAENVTFEMLDKIKFLHDEGEYNGIGRYRVHVPYFSLSQGNCFLYLKESIDDSNVIIHKLNKGFFWSFLSGVVNTSLNGIKISSGTTRDYRGLFDCAYIEVDFEKTDDIILDVSRHSLNIDIILQGMISFLNKKINELILKHLSAFDNIYGTINRSCLVFKPEQAFWFSKIHNGSLEQELVYTRLDPPMCNSFSLQFFDSYSTIYNGRKLNYVSYIYDCEQRQSINFYNYITGDFRLGILNVATRKTQKKLLPILTDYSFVGQEKKKELKAIWMPDGFQNALFYDSLFDYLSSDSHNYYLNSNHDLYKYFDSEIFYNADPFKINPDQSPTEKKNKCFSFLIKSVIRNNNDWTEFCIKRQAELEYAFNVLDITELIVLDHNYVLTIFEIGSCKTCRPLERNFPQLDIVDQSFHIQNNNSSRPAKIYDRL